MNTYKVNHFFFRLPLAVSFLGHGLVRLPKLPVFSQWMVTSMEKSAIPSFVIVSFSYVLPFAEALTGLFLLIGFQVRYTIYAGLIIMSMLILGSASIENWSAIETQLVHAIYFGCLLWFCEKKQNEETSGRVHPS